MSLMLHREVRRAREQFLSEGDIDVKASKAVRPEIYASWRRSRLSGVKPDATVQPSGAEAPDDHPLLLASLAPIARLADQLVGLDTRLQLSDSESRVLRRWQPVTPTRPKFQRVESDCGSSWSEETIGTNGIGTIAEIRRSLMIVGSEHLAESLTPFMCIGAPIFHPLRRSFAGIVTLSAEAAAASPLLTALISATTCQIEQGLLDLTSVDERTLFDVYLRTRRANKSIAVIGEKILFTGPRVTAQLRGVDAATVWDLVLEKLSAGPHDNEVVLPLASGPLVLTCSPIHLDARLIGAKLAILEKVAAYSQPIASTVGNPADMFPSASTAARAPSTAPTTVSQPQPTPLLVTGEPGTGKRTLLESMIDKTITPGQPRIVVVDFARDGAARRCKDLASQSTDRFCDAIVLRHLDQITAAAAPDLGRLVEALRGDSKPPRLMATANPENAWPADASVRRLIDQLDGERIDLAPLRDRPDDIPDLIDVMVQRSSGPSRLRFSSSAELALKRAPWPENLRQLKRVVHAIQERPPGELIEAESLPDGLGVYALRRRLTLMERAEFGAIVSTLNRSQGNKLEAARLLGISRSTLYRKMRYYRLDQDRYFF